MLRSEVPGVGKESRLSAEFIGKNNVDQWTGMLFDALDAIGTTPGIYTPEIEGDRQWDCPTSTSA